MSVEAGAAVPRPEDAGLAAAGFEDFLAAADFADFLVPPGARLFAVFAPLFGFFRLVVPIVSDNLSVIRLNRPAEFNRSRYAAQVNRFKLSVLFPRTVMLP